MVITVLQRDLGSRKVFFRTKGWGLALNAISEHSCVEVVVSNSMPSLEKPPCARHRRYRRETTLQPHLQLLRRCNNYLVSTQPSSKSTAIIQRKHTPWTGAGYLSGISHSRIHAKATIVGFALPTVGSGEFETNRTRDAGTETRCADHSNSNSTTSL